MDFLKKIHNSSDVDIMKSSAGNAKFMLKISNFASVTSIVYRKIDWYFTSFIKIIFIELNRTKGNKLMPT